MPCAYLKEDYVRDAHLNGDTPITVDPSQIIYQPFYDLPRWAATCNSRATNTPSATAATRYTIDLVGLDDVTWSMLGHAGLDQAALPKMTNEEAMVFSQLQMSVTFMGQPQAFDVNRGLWDMKAPRSAGIKLSAKAPQVIQGRVCKTTRILVAWVYEITLKLPKTIDDDVLQGVSLAFLRLPFIPLEDGRTWSVNVGGTGWPVIVAALAALV